MSDRKVVKFKKRKTINIGIIVFIILFIYIAINVYLYFTKDKVSIYEVKEGSTAIDNRITALILREEKVVYSDKAGFISYFQKEGARVAKNASVYSIDDSGDMYEIVTNGEIPVTLTEKNSAEFNHEVKRFLHSFSDSDYSKVYEFKDSAQSTVLDIINTALINQGQALLDESGLALNYQLSPSPESGIITYYVDHFEDVTPESINDSMFDSENYIKTSLKTTDMVAANSPIYKIVTSEVWNLILPLTDDIYERLLQQDRVAFTILKDNFTMKADLKLLQRGSSHYAQLTLDKYLSNYLNERFLDIELDLNTVEGLKIPVSSIVEKEFYMVPKDYIAKGANSKNDGLTKETYDSETGEVTFTFVPATVYYEDEEYAYVDAALFSPGTWIRNTKTSERFQIAQMSKLTGVYNINQGYAVFKYIEILYQNEEYCIIAKNTKYGLALYDHIALDGTTVVEQKIIY